MKRFVSLLLASFIILSFISVPVFSTTSASGNEQLEVVILLDVSNSMNDSPRDHGELIRGSDPEVEIEGVRTRFTIEAIQNFIWNCPPQVDMHVSLVVFNDSATIVTESSINVNKTTNPNGIGDVEEYLDQILRNEEGKWWRGLTNIVDALEKSESIFDDVGDSVTKGIILFSDGEHTASSDKRVGVQIVEDFTQPELNHFYSIGLHAVTNNPNETTTFNEDYLNELGEKAGRPPFIVNPNIGQNLTRVVYHLEGIFADLATDVHQAGDSISFPMDGTIQSFPFDVYGEITRGVTVTITTEITKLKDIKILVNGDEVSYIIDDSNNTDFGEITVRQSPRTVNVSILNPIDGDWEIYFRGTGDETAQITRLKTHRLSLERDGNRIFLFNELSQRAVGLQRVYDDAEFVCSVVGESGQKSFVSSRVSTNGFELDFSNVPSGEYQLTATMVVNWFNEFTQQTEAYFPLVKLEELILIGCDCGFACCAECKGDEECGDINECKDCYPCDLKCCVVCKGNMRCDNETCSICYCDCNECGCTVCFEDGECKKCGCVNCFEDGKCGECVSCNVGWIVFGISCVILVIVIKIMMIKVPHKIRFENSEDPLYISHKSPLFITANESADYNNQHIVPSYNCESFKGNDLAKIEAVHNFIPMPIFYRKLKITPLFEEGSEIEMDASVDNPVTVQDDIALTFRSGIGESLTVRFDYYIKSQSAAEEDGDVGVDSSNDVIGFESEDDYEE